MGLGSMVVIDVAKSVPCNNPEALPGGSGDLAGSLIRIVGVIVWLLITRFPTRRDKFP